MRMGCRGIGLGGRRWRCRRETKVVFVYRVFETICTFCSITSSVYTADDPGDFVDFSLSLMGGCPLYMYIPWNFGYCC